MVPGRAAQYGGVAIRLWLLQGHEPRDPLCRAAEECKPRGRVGKAPCGRAEAADRRRSEVGLHVPLAVFAAGPLLQTELISESARAGESPVAVRRIPGGRIRSHRNLS